MPRPWYTPGMIAAVILVAGCADDPLVLKGQLQSANQQQAALTRQNQEAQNRAIALDKNNQELEAQLGQAQQKNRLLEDQLSAMRDQLSGVTSQLAQVRDQKQSTEAKVQALTASLRRQGGVTITPNSSLQMPLPALNIPEVNVRRDGDVVRVELPGGRLFDTASARLRPGSQQLITAVAAELLRTYPEQIIGVEGHTDNDPLFGGQFRNNHELSVARANAIYDVLVSQARIPAGHLFLAGHGPNHPVVSNATLEGKERNRRVELVVYPDRVGGR